MYEGQPLYSEIIEHFQRLGVGLWNILPGFVDPASGRLLEMDGVFFKTTT